VEAEAYVKNFKLHSSLMEVHLLDSSESESNSKLRSLDSGFYSGKSYHLPSWYFFYSDSDSDFCYPISVCQTKEIKWGIFSGIISYSGQRTFSNGLGLIGNEHLLDVNAFRIPSMRGDAKFTAKNVVKRNVSVPTKPATDRFIKNSLCRKLKTTFPKIHYSQVGCQINSIHSRFQEINCDVEVQRSEKKPNTYIIIFQDSIQAQEALSRSEEICYTLSKEWLRRPGPNYPIKYRSLDLLMIRAGKALTGKLEGKLTKGKIVIVNQVKSRKARLAKENRDAQLTWGWVSMHTLSRGVTLFLQVDNY